MRREEDALVVGGVAVFRGAVHADGVVRVVHCHVDESGFGASGVVFRYDETVAIGAVENAAFDKGFARALVSPHNAVQGHEDVQRHLFGSRGVVDAYLRSIERNAQFAARGFVDQVVQLMEHVDGVAGAVVFVVLVYRGVDFAVEIEVPAHGVRPDDLVHGGSLAGRGEMRVPLPQAVYGLESVEFASVLHVDAHYPSLRGHIRLPVVFVVFPFARPLHRLRALEHGVGPSHFNFF